MSLRTALLADVAETPSTVELRALLMDPSTTLAGSRGAAIVRSDLHWLVALVGNPPSATLAPILRATGPEWALLAPSPRSDLPPGWRWERALLHTLAREDALEAAARAAAGVVVPLQPTMLAGLGALRAELSAALARTQVLCALADGRPASFAYVPLRSEAYFDLSVDTLPAFRCRGLARLVAAAVIRLERRSGREPVWGALESNLPSRRVAEALGFEAVAELWVATRD